MPQENQIDKIEQYHSGNMSPEEAVSFEKELAADPSLKAESDFQSEIINGIKEYRKSQLKTRLDAIDVSPGWFEFAQQSTLVKSFGGIALATAIGSGVYFLADTKEDIPQPKEIANIESISDMTVPVYEVPQFEWAIKELETVETKNIEKEQNVARGETAAIESANRNEAAPTSTQTTVSEVEEKQEESFTPDFSAPDAGDVSDNSEISSATLDEVTEVASTKSELQPIEVETKNSKGSKIKYKYYDGKLFLNGNFSKEPYEILEINSANGRRIYLLHLNKYYEVKINDRLSELPEVTDIKLIRELRLIKANK